MSRIVSKVGPTFALLTMDSRRKLTHADGRIEYDDDAETPFRALPSMGHARRCQRAQDTRGDRRRGGRVRHARPRLVCTVSRALLSLIIVPSSHLDPVQTFVPFSRRSWLQIKKTRPEDRLRMNRLQRKRERQRIKRRDARRRRRCREHAAKARWRPPELLGVYSSLVGLERTTHRGTHTIKFPSVFSFIEQPDDALQVLEEIVSYSMGDQHLLLTLDQSDCTRVDLGAQAAASVLAKSAFQNHGVDFRGKFPKERAAREQVLAAGLPKNMGLQLKEPPGFLCYPLRYGKRGRDRGFRSSDAEWAAQHFVEYINRCLGRHGSKLSLDGVEYLSTIVTEVLNNAEEHSEKPHWWIAGYLRSPPDGEPSDCRLTLFNFGRSIAESLRTLPKESMQRRSIEEILVAQRAATRPRRKWFPEKIWTILAIQQRVSRKNISRTEIGNQGQGLAKLIQFFQRIGQSGSAGPAKMCIVSGRTFLLFDGKYPIQPIPPDGRLRIALNASNDLKTPPDGDYARRLNKVFPGTLISLRFHLDKDHLNELEGPT